MKLKFPHKIENFICKHSERLDVDVDKVKAMLALWAATVSFMWFYVVFCYYGFGGWGPVTTGGIIFSILHSLTPLVFFTSGSMKITGMVLSFTGLGFQALFCVYSGGVFSPSAIWFSLHPVLLAFFGDISIIVVSICLNVIIILSLYFAEVFGVLPANQLPASFHYAMNISSYIGLDILIALFTILTVYIHKKNNKIISAKKDMIENFIKILSHDINNPLTVSRAQTHRLKKGKITPEQAVEKISFANHQILDIVTSVRHWMAHKEGKMNLKNEDILCSDIVDHVQKSFDERLQHKLLKLSVKNELDQQQSIQGDRNAIMYQIINNMMSNAIKFTPKESTIELGLKKEDHWIVIYIADQGRGIDEKLKEKIFSPFEQTSTDGTEGEGGTGFGMPILKTLMDKMNGEVSIDNRYQGEEILGAVVTLKFKI